MRAAAAALPMDDAEFYGRIGASPFGDPALTVRERTTLRPTIEVNGMWGGYTGMGTKTVLPSEAHAKITMRLAPVMDPLRARDKLRAHLKAATPQGVRIGFGKERDGTPAPTLPEDHPLLRAASTAIERVLGQKPIPVRSGGTLPVAAIFEEMLGIGTLACGLALPDENIHAPNEFFHLASLDEGLRIWPALLSEVG